MKRCNLCDADLSPRAAWEPLLVQPGFEILWDGRCERFDIQTALCLECGLVFTHPQPEAELLARFYAAQERELFAPDGRGGDRIPAETGRRDQAAWLAARVGPLLGRRVLEIGCYDGYLLDRLRAAGAQVLGIEPSEAAAELGRRRFGIDIRTALVEDVSLPLASLDVIVLSHVLEHLADPRETLLRCRRWLRPGGFLFVEVPNVLAPRVESAVHFFTFDHLYNWSPETLTEHLLRTGFEANAVDDDFPFPAFRMLAVAAKPGRSRSEELRPGRDRVRGSVEGYARRRERFLTRLRGRVDSELADWCSRDRSVVLYGAGYHTEYLLAETRLSQARIVGLVDGNPAKQGRRILGYPVFAPEDLPRLNPDVVVVSSYDFQDEMVARVRALLGQRPQVVAFYRNVRAFSGAGWEPRSPAA
ncbi:MAG: methyltransferase domain-containing protein [Proteobacteria bacterium]|nr:methyltransferase domain-containing protein [Pseudomonadota bacterium]